MANPRRSSYSSETQSQQQTQSHFVSLSSLLHFLKKPHAFPFLLSVFVLLTWVSLRLQHPSNNQDQVPHPLKRSHGDDDDKANLVRFGVEFLSSRDKRGWLLNPVNAANDAGLQVKRDYPFASFEYLDLGGPQAETHLELKPEMVELCLVLQRMWVKLDPGGMRGNHRHYTCNETFVIWGAETKFRLENLTNSKGYTEVIIGADEVAVVSSPSGIAHALVNIDPVRTTFFLGCQDSVVTYNSSTSDFNVWKDL